MKYVMLVCSDPSIELSAQLRMQGQELAGVEAATTIRVRGGEVVIADGPFAETKEQIGGF